MEKNTHLKENNTNDFAIFWRNSGVFQELCLLFLIIVGWVLLHYGKADIHLWMNGNHCAAWDFFFRYYTYVGEWVPYVIVVGLLFYKAGWASFLLTDVLLSGLIAQRLKYVADTDRPYRYFAENMPDVQLPFVDGVELSEFYSFPSGHTTTFFAMMMVLCMIGCEYVANHVVIRENVKKWWIYLIIPFTCFVWAVLGAYSRIYLSQHFLEDIFGGAIIGIVTTIILCVAIPRLQGTRFWNWTLSECLWKGEKKK